MTSADRWLLPEGVEEILPAEAHKLEMLRRELLDLYAGWGYELVVAPLVEFLDSLLIGTSRDLDLQTFKITDQLSGRMMGVRADITPQVARMDARTLNRDVPVRLCYADNVLHTRPRGLLTSRVPLRIGAELFGHAGTACDEELICLMIATLERAGIDHLHLILGHVGIFRSLVREAELSAAVEARLFDAMQRKARAEIDELLASEVSQPELRELIDVLSRMSGGEQVLEQAQEAFASAPESVRQELADLAAIAGQVRRRLPSVRLGFDLCELRGYEYHTGIVFAAYSTDYGRAVAKGGRYNDIGKVFGRARPACGFDADLKIISRLSTRDFPLAAGIYAPSVDDELLDVLIARLRDEGEKVIRSLDVEMPDEKVIREMQCDRVIKHHEGRWQVVNVN